MKTSATRIVCLLLICVFILPALTACPNKDKDENVEMVVGTGEDRFKDADFGGETIKLCLPGANSGSDGAKYMSGLDEKSGKPYENDTITETIRERNEYVQGKLNLKVAYTYLDSDWSTVYETMMTRFNAHDGFADAAAIQIYGMVKCMMAGIFTNANSDQYTNYFALNETGWYEDSMQAFSFGQDVSTGKIFLLASDYFLDIIRCADVMFVNESVYEEKIGGTIDDLYWHITQGSWTYDRLNEYVKAGYNNTNPSNPGVDADDNLGLVYAGTAASIKPSADTAMGIVYSSGINFVVNNGGVLEYADVSNAFTTLLSKTRTVFEQRGAFSISGEEGTHIDVFAKNKTIFSMTMRLMDLENSKLDTIGKCPLPYPKLNASDDYEVLVHDLASVGGIFKGGKFTEVSAFWQYATIRSEPTRIKYYEDGLKLKYDTGSNTNEVLDVIYNALTTSTAFAWDSFIRDTANYADATTFYSLYLNSVENDSFASKWAECRDLKRSGLSYAQNEFNNLS